MINYSNVSEETRNAMLNVMEDLEIEKAKAEAIIGSLGEGLIAVDNSKKVILINRVAEDMLGYKLHEILGKVITNLPLEDEDGNLIPLDRRPTTIALKTGELTLANHFFVRKDGTRFPISIIVTPIKLNKKIIGLIEVIRDVTHERNIDKAKSEFVSLASHQLRTPLGIIKWYIEALVEEAFFKKAPKLIQNYLNQIYKNNERVLALVRDLLSVSRIEQGKIKNNPSLVDVNKVLVDIVSQMQIMANKNNIKLGLKFLNKNIPIIRIDAFRLHEVLENLISNAVEYTLSTGTVDVIVQCSHEIITVKIKDSGIGISVMDQRRLFTKFFRSEKAIGHNPEGSGLGLYVVKSYVEEWGGHISVESVEGEGSIFTISLPVVKGGELQ